jgi:organic hydroperoxide reductase OsmC/OhrA
MIVRDGSRPGVEPHFCKARLRDPVLAPASVTLDDLFQVTARVGIGPAKEGGFGLTVAFDLDAPRLDLVQATTLMDRAHELRPYSGATRGNLDAALTVGGESIGGRAA